MNDFVTSTVDIKLTSAVVIKLMLHIDIYKNFKHIFFQTNFCCQWLFSRYILDIILNSSIRYLQFDISRMSKSGGDVPWYWPNVDVNLKFECPLGGNIGLVMKSITFEKVDVALTAQGWLFFYLKTIFILFCIIKYIMNTFHWLIQSHYHMQL